MPPCLQKDPGEPDKGGFEGGNDSTMTANDLYASWKKGNDHQTIAEMSTQVIITCNGSRERRLHHQPTVITALFI